QGMIKPHLFVGPYFAYNHAAKLKTEYNGHSEEIDWDAVVKDTDFGAIFGGGIDFGLPAGKIVFDARYSLGLTTTYEEFFEVDLKNSVFSFMLGYAF
ncbi:outer membrane beta-barrel protein, partial [bacterium]|nr:outer membrane beta-barrel protein [bacterium]